MTYTKSDRIVSGAASDRFVLLDPTFSISLHSTSVSARHVANGSFAPQRPHQDRQIIELWTITDATGFLYRGARSGVPNATSEC